jgi:FSR family fosmidomycin resistance protein-like MFS transporter
VDGVCAATLFGTWGNSSEFTLLSIIYSTLAFATQGIFGLIADRFKHHAQVESISMLLVALGFLLPAPPWLKIGLLGIGNSIFHVAGGIMTLEHSGGKAGKLGVFVAPGSVGLTLGMLFPSLGGLFTVLLILCSLLPLPISVRLPSPVSRIPAVSLPMRRLLPAILLPTAAVAVRAIGGTVVRFPWNTTLTSALAMTGAVFLGKMLGGFVCDRIGIKSSACLSILPAVLLISFCSEWMLPSLLGQFALNLTMPVTLWLLYRAMPDSPGFAFGLAASALLPGTMAGYLIQPNTSASPTFTVISFLFGLVAILTARRLLSIPDPNKHTEVSV